MSNEQGNTFRQPHSHENKHVRSRLEVVERPSPTVSSPRRRRGVDELCSRKGFDDCVSAVRFSIEWQQKTRQKQPPRASTFRLRRGVRASDESSPDKLGNTCTRERTNSVYQFSQIEPRVKVTSRARYIVGVTPEALGVGVRPTIDFLLWLSYGL